MYKLTKFVKASGVALFQGGLGGAVSGTIDHTSGGCPDRRVSNYVGDGDDLPCGERPTP